MRAIVFGGSGFLGSHVADALSEKGYEVTIFDKVSSSYLQESQKMVLGDIMDQALVEATVKGTSVVYNFAGIADIEEASKEPLETVNSNIIGNTIILEACRKDRVKRFVYASSIYVYSKAGSFYRSTKQACELLIENYNEVYKLPFTILRYGSLYGPRADSRNFIYQIIRQALTERKIMREGDGDEIREYIHAYDAAKASVEILSDEFKNEYVIITGNQQTRVRDLLLMIKEMMNDQIEIEYVKPRYSFHYEISPYTFAPKLAKRLVNRTHLDLGQGILKCMETMYKEIAANPDHAQKK